MNTTLVMVVLVAMCVGLSLGRPRGRNGDKNPKRNHKPEKLHKFMCKLQNSTDTLLNKTCGCGNETDLGVTCSLGPLTVTKDDQSFQAFFCAISPNWTDPDQPWRGALRAACRIHADGEVLKNESCKSHNGVDPECSVGPLPFTVNETRPAEAYFCQRPERTDEDGDEGRARGRRRNSASNSHDDDDADAAGDDEDEDADEQETCVPLSKRHCKGDHKRDGQRKDRDRSPNTPNEPESLGVEGDVNDNADTQSGQDRQQHRAKGPKIQQEGRRQSQQRPAGDQGRQGRPKGKGKAKGQ